MHDHPFTELDHQRVALVNRSGARNSMRSSITVNFIDDDVSMVVHGSGGSRALRSIHSEDERNPVSLVSRVFRNRGQSIDLSGESNHRAGLPERRAIALMPPRSWTTVEIDANELASLR